MSSREFKEHYDLHLGLQFNCDDCDIIQMCLAYELAMFKLMNFNKNPV